MKIILRSSIPILFLISSCGIFWPTTKEYKAKQCYFDPEIKSIIYSGEYPGIKHISVFISTLGSETKYFKVFEKEYTPPTRAIKLLDVLGDSIDIKSSDLIINIWDKSPVLEDYNLKINQGNWNSSKKIFSTYNYR
jgi:hypothetical protein